MSGEPRAVPDATGDLRRQAALLVGATLAVFFPTLSSDFVYDARLQILTDPFLHDVRNWWPVLTFQTLAMDVLDFNRPVNLASLMLDATLWGRQPFGYHLTSVLLHAANVLLVWAVWRRLAAETATAAAAAGSWLDVATAILPPLLFAVRADVSRGPARRVLHARRAADRDVARAGRRGGRLVAGGGLRRLLPVGDRQQGVGRRGRGRARRLVVVLSPP